MNRDQVLIDEIEATLRSITLLFPIAGDKLNNLCTLYTSTYMLKLRAMK